MPPHPDLKLLQSIFPAIREYQRLASNHSIEDIFQDNGGKILQMVLVLGLRVTGAREGNDAIDEDGNEYELKTVNVLKQKQFTTHHHLNPVILAKYRLVDWYFGVYEGIELREIYRLTPEQLEPYFKMWEEKWHVSGGRDINNPKIPLRFVRQTGTQIYVGAIEQPTLKLP